MHCSVESSRAIVRQGLIVVGLLAVSDWVGAQTAEYITSETTAAESVEELDSSLNETEYLEPSTRMGFWGFLDAGPFLRDADLSFRFRGYNFERTDGTGATLSRAFAAGGELAFQSGRWNEMLSVAASWYTSQGIDAPENFDGTGLLGPGQSDISVLGKAFVKLDFEGGITARFYRQDFMLPYINRQDSRMIPNTHEAYRVTRLGERLSYIAGHVTKIKLRTSDEFIPMAEAAGVLGGTAGTSIGGLRYTTAGDLEIGGLTAYTHDAFNIAYAETNWVHTFNDDLGFRFSAQYTDQRSVGREDLGNFSTNTWGIRVGGSYRNAVLTLAYTDTDEDAPIRSPFGGRPSYNSMMLLNFDRPGERAWRLGATYDFGRIGLPGFSLQMNLAAGKDAVDSATGIRLDDNSEQNFTIDYRPEQGKLAGLWIRFRRASADRMDPGADRRDYRLIIRYDFAML